MNRASPKPSGTIQVLLVDDHEVVRSGIREFLAFSKSITVVGEADCAAAALAEAQRLRPNVVVMDLKLPDASGVEACREILACVPATRVLFLSSYEEKEGIMAAVLAGASGYLLKRVGREELGRAIVRIAGGESILDPAVTQPVFERLHALTSQQQDGLPPPTEQENRILALVAEGKSNKEIAVQLGISEYTARNILSRLFKRYGLINRAKAAVWFLKTSHD